MVDNNDEKQATTVSRKMFEREMISLKIYMEGLQKSKKSINMIIAQTAVRVVVCLKV